jgi:hypothetical protein
MQEQAERLSGTVAQFKLDAAAGAPAARRGPGRALALRPA